MRQNLYTCCRCGAKQVTHVDDVPIGWAVVTFTRHTSVEGQLKRYHFVTHACADCSDEVVNFLEKASLDVDVVLDDGAM